MKLVYAKNPKWANRSQTIIDLTVRFEEIDEDLPFTANPEDSEPHGREIFARALNNDFGDIGAFDVPPPTIETVAEEIKLERNNRLAATDWTQLPDVPQSTKELWEPYRQQLRDLPQDLNFPWYSQVVVETDFGYFIDVNKAPFPTPPA